MSCKDYHDALTEAAATNSVLQPSLQLHLDTCADCRAALVQQQSLFAAIDSSLGAIANPEIPADLLSRVQSQLLSSQAVPVKKYFWLWDWKLALVAPAVLCIAIFPFLRRVNTTDVQPVREANLPPLQPETLIQQPVPAQKKIEKPRRTAITPKRESTSPSKVDRELEVIFSVEEQKGYRQLVSAVQKQETLLGDLAAKPLQSEDKPKQLEPLQIVSVEIAPLVDSED